MAPSDTTTTTPTTTTTTTTPKTTTSTSAPKSAPDTGSVPNGKENWRGFSLWIVGIIVICLIVVIGFAIYYYMKSLAPDISTKHKENCDKLRKVFDTMKISADSALRQKYCDDSARCPLHLRPKSTEPVCEGGRVLNGASPYYEENGGEDPALGPCCTFPPEANPEKESLLQSTIEAFNRHPLIGSVVTLFIAQKIYKLTTWAIKPLKSGKLERLAGKPDKIAGKMARKMAAKLGGKVEDEAEDKALSKMYEEMIEKLDLELSEKIMAKLGSKATEMLGLGGVPIVGWIIDLLMAISMVLDLADVGGYRQYISNRDYLDMRDMAEGAFIDANKNMGIEPPFFFTLDQLKLKFSMLPKEDQKGGDAEKILSIYDAYTKALTSHVADVLKIGESRLTEEDDKAIDAAAASVLDGKDIDIKKMLPDDLIDRLTSAFSEDPIHRDKEIWKYLKANLRADLHKYIQIDTGISANNLHAITLSYPEGYNLWNNYIKNNKKAGGLPLAVYSEYYRVIAPNGRRPGKKDDPIKNTPRHTLRDAGEKYIEDKAGFGSMDMRGQTIYTLETKKLPRKWMQISASKGILETKCRKGLHLPSIAHMLATAADEKMCKTSGHTWKGASCSDMEYAMNELDCVASGAEWTPSSCIGNDGKNLSGLMETGISHYTDTVQKAAVNATASKEGKDAPTKIDKSNYKGDISKAFGNTSVLDAGGDALVGGAVAGSVGAGVGFIAGYGASDVFPQDYGVKYDDDTGICDFSAESASGASKWCNKMGLETLHGEVDAALYSDQTYTDCDSNFSQDALEMIVGQTFVRSMRKLKTDLHDAVVKGEIMLGGLLQSTGISAFSKAGGGIHSSGSLAYFLDGHEAERLAHITGLSEKSGKAIDKTIHNTGRWACDHSYLAWATLNPALIIGSAVLC